jgi:bifunctional NMN adenylyltransferase/nudix hydrolase
LQASTELQFTNMKEYNAAVFIGRFQPLHNEHLHVLREGLKIADKVVILVGSYLTAPSIKNPFTFEQRRAMIEASLSDQERHRVKVHPIRDHYYSDNLWVANVQQVIREEVGDGTVTLIGAHKDASSYYLNLFSQWDFFAVPQKAFINATDLRKHWFDLETTLMDYNHYHPHTAYDALKGHSNKWKKDLPDEVIDWLDRNYFPTQHYHSHVQEYRHYQEYKKEWGSGPFVTVDAVVTCAGHVLLVKRKFLPGRGLWALPGGFLKPTELLKDGAIRELREETRIDVPKQVLNAYVVDNRVFDYPGRSLRGRTITHTFHVKLPDGQLPKVSGADDAASATWMSVNDVYMKQDRFFEDHLHIISHFITRS